MRHGTDQTIPEYSGFSTRSGQTWSLIYVLKWVFMRAKIVHNSITSPYIIPINTGECRPIGVIPMFPSPYVPQSLCSPLYDISPYVSHVPQSLCYPEMFPSPVAPQTYIIQSLCSPVPMFPIFPSPYVPQSLCSPLYDISPYVPHVPQSLCYPEMFPSPVAPQTYIIQSLCSPVPMFPIFPSPYVSQSLCSPVPALPSPFVSQSL